MRRRNKVVAVLLVIVVCAGLAYPYVDQSLRTRYVYEVPYSQVPEKGEISLDLMEMSDANVTIGFDNETDLAVRVVIDYYSPPSREPTVVAAVPGSPDALLMVEFDARVRHVSVVFGTRRPVNLNIDGHHLNVSILLDHGAYLRSSLMRLDFSGVLNITVTEDIRMGGGRSVIETLGLEYVALADISIDLPADVYGVLGLYGDYRIEENEGWSLYTAGVYTLLRGEGVLGLVVRLRAVGFVSAWLYD